MSTWTFAKTREWSGFSQRSCVIWFPPPNPCSVLLDHSICRSDVKVERRWCLANSPHNFCMIRFTERAVVFRRNRSCSQWDCIFNFSNPYLISYRILGEILTRLLISWSYDLHRFLSLLRLLTFFFFFNGKWPWSGNFSIVFYKNYSKTFLLSAAFISSYHSGAEFELIKNLSWASVLDF